MVAFFSSAKIWNKLYWIIQIGHLVIQNHPLSLTSLSVNSTHLPKYQYTFCIGRKSRNKRRFPISLNPPTTVLKKHTQMDPWWSSYQWMNYIPPLMISMTNYNLIMRTLLERKLYSVSGDLTTLNTLIKLKNGKSITIHHLLKSLPASSGMSRPQLFQHLEPNHTL